MKHRPSSVSLRSAPLLALSLVLEGCSGGAGVGCLFACPPPPVVEVAIDVGAADLNGDGRPDVVLPVTHGVNDPGEVLLYLHAPQEGGTFLPAVHFGLGPGLFSTILVADLDGDHYPDLIITLDASAQSLVVLRNDPNEPGTFLQPQTLDVSFPNQVAVADVNGDGLPDILIAADTVLVALQNPSAPGTFLAPLTLYTNPGTTGPTAFVAIAAGDLNGDGTPDLVVADETSVRVLFLTPGGGPPSVASSVVLLTNPVVQNADVTAVAIADVDRDGRNDVVIMDPALKQIGVLRQSATAAGHFLAFTPYPLPGGTGHKLLATDLDGDGYPDLITGGDALGVWLQDAQHPGTFLAATSYPVPFQADGIAVADVDGDGLPDLVTDAGVSTSGDGASSPPGVLLQDPAHPGHFLPIQDLGGQ